MKKQRITDPRFSWINSRRQFEKYGWLEVGQRVVYSRTKYAPTNKVDQPLRSCMRLPTGEIVQVDPDVTIETQHSIIDIRESESGAFIFLVDDDGILSCAGSNGIFRVLRHAPRQMGIAA